MVEWGANLTGDMITGLDKFEARIKESAVLSGVAAMANVMYGELKLNTSPPKLGRVTGKLNEAVYRFYAKDRSSDVEKVYHVSIRKSQAPHWALIEYGTSKMRARAPIRHSLSALPQAVEAGKERIRERLAQGVVGTE